MIYNKQISKSLGYDVYSPSKEKNFIEALSKTIIILAIAVVLLDLILN